MSKRMEKEELIKHCENSIAQLQEVIMEFGESPLEKMRKRAMLLGYWIKTYAQYLKAEDTFSPHNVYRLKRGSVIQVEFGYRVGRELGGRHYAVVIDAKNSIHRNTVTVVPLGSVKEKTKQSGYGVQLEDGVFELVYNKINAVLGECEKIITEAENMKEEIAKAKAEDIPTLRTVQRTKIEAAKGLNAKAKIWIEEILHLKPGSIANVDQITTISKMRIMQPLKKTHPLYGVRLSDRDMDKIDEKIRELYFLKGE